jgi:hypothetical protein
MEIIAVYSENYMNRKYTLSAKCRVLLMLWLNVMQILIKYFYLKF